MTSPWCQGDAIGPHLETPSGNRDAASLGCNLPRSADMRELQSGGIRRVGDEGVGQGERVEIHRPGDGDAEPPPTSTPLILNGDIGTRRDGDQSADHRAARTMDSNAWVPRRANRSNSPTSTRRNRTRSPGRNRNGSWRSGMKGRSGVRPKVYHALGTIVGTIQAWIPPIMTAPAGT